MEEGEHVNVSLKDSGDPVLWSGSKTLGQQFDKLLAELITY